MSAYKQQKNKKSMLTSSWKDSGVDWIGNIPSDWKVIVLKYGAFLFTGNSIADKNLFLTSDNSYSYIATKDVDINNHSINYSNGIFIPKSNYKFKISKKNSTLLCIEGGSAGQKIAFSDRDICFGNKLCSIKSNNKYISDKYIYYFTQNNLFKTQFFLYLNGLIGGVSVYFIKNFMYLNPPKKTQQRIVVYLDEKTSGIDSLIEKKEKMIELLKEKRSSLITNAVTCGLDTKGKLRQKPKSMPASGWKDSGVEWIGDIPEEWSVKPAFVYLEQTKNKNIGLKEKNLLSLSYGNIINKKLSSNFGLLPESFETYQIVLLGQIIFRFTDLQNDKKSLRSGLVHEKGIITSAYVAVKIKDDTIVLPNYFDYLFRSYDLQKVFYTLGSGVRQSSDFKDLRKLSIVMSDMQTQQRLVNFLNKKTSEIDGVISKIEKQIELLGEYRASLIYHVVTGKISI